MNQAYHFISAFADNYFYVGNLNNHANHGVSGEVYVVDEGTLLIRGFTYDGLGPDAFFTVGTSGTPSSAGTILPFPFEGQFYNLEDQSAPTLRRSDYQDIWLTLPNHLRVRDLRWLSVWCRAFTRNFGDIFFPEVARPKLDEDAFAAQPEPAQQPAQPSVLKSVLGIFQKIIG